MRSVVLFLLIALLTGASRAIAYPTYKELMQVVRSADLVFFGMVENTARALPDCRLRVRFSVEKEYIGHAGVHAVCVSIGIPEDFRDVKAGDRGLFLFKRGKDSTSFEPVLLGAWFARAKTFEGEWYVFPAGTIRDVNSTESHRHLLKGERDYAAKLSDIEKEIIAVASQKG